MVGVVCHTFFYSMEEEDMFAGFVQGHIPRLMIIVRVCTEDKQQSEIMSVTVLTKGRRKGKESNSP